VYNNSRKKISSVDYFVKVCIVHTWYIVMYLVDIPRNISGTYVALNWTTCSPSNLDSWSLDARCVACRFYGKLLSILIDVNYRRVWHAAVCRTRARHTACAVRCNGAPRCNDATVLRVNSWESLDNGAYRCRHPRRDTFGRSRKDRTCTRVLIRIGQFFKNWTRRPFQNTDAIPAYILTDDIRSNIGQILMFKTLCCKLDELSIFYLEWAYHSISAIL